MVVIVFDIVGSEALASLRIVSTILQSQMLHADYANAFEIFPQV